MTIIILTTFIVCINPNFLLFKREPVSVKKKKKKGEFLHVLLNGIARRPNWTDATLGVQVDEKSALRMMGLQKESGTSNTANYLF